MKKIVFVSFFIGFSMVHAFGQWSGGIKGGINFTQQKWKIDLAGFGGSQKYKGAAFHIGGYLNYKLSEALFVQPELLYNSLKFDVEGEDITMNYLSVPVLLGYGFEQNKFNLHAGPQLGILLSTDPSEFKDSDFVKTVDFSFAFGASVNVKKVVFTVRYAVGIMNIVTDKFNDSLEAEVGEPVDLSIKNNNLQISIGYKLFGE